MSETICLVAIKNNNISTWYGSGCPYTSFESTFIKEQYSKYAVLWLFILTFLFDKLNMVIKSNLANSALRPDGCGYKLVALVCLNNNQFKL